MMKVTWLTDLHLEFVRDERTLETLAESVRAAEPNAVLLDGDTGTAETMERHPRWLAGALVGCGKVAAAKLNALHRRLPGPRHLIADEKQPLGLSCRLSPGRHSGVTDCQQVLLSGERRYFQVQLLTSIRRTPDVGGC